MLISSLPLLSPPTTHLLSSTTSFPSSSPASAGPRSSNPNSRNRSSRVSQQPYINNPHSLSALAAEEHAISARKEAIQKFGWEWIKPAGCPRTMAGREEEEEERRAAEEAMAQAMDEQWGEAQGPDGQTETMEGQEAEAEGAEERDLDDEVPDADPQPSAQDRSGIEEGDEENSALLPDETSLEDSALNAAETPAQLNTVSRAVHFAQQPSAFTATTDQLPNTTFNAHSVNTLTPSNTASALTLHPRPVEESEMMMTPLSPVHPLSPTADIDLDADIPDALSELDESGEWQHTDTDASLPDDSPSPPSSPRPLITATPSRRSMRLVSPSVNAQPGRNRGQQQQQQQWLRGASGSQQARESSSPSALPRLGPATRNLRVRGVGEDSSSPIAPDSAGPSNASRNVVSGGRRMFSGRANPFQRRFSGQQRQGQEAGGEGQTGRTVSTGEVRRTLRREN